MGFFVVVFCKMPISPSLFGLILCVFDKTLTAQGSQITSVI